MLFRFRIGKFLIKTCRIAVRFYLGYQKQPWFGPGGSENACIFRMRKWRVATRLYTGYCNYPSAIYFAITSACSSSLSICCNNKSIIHFKCGSKANLNRNLANYKLFLFLFLRSSLHVTIKNQVKWISMWRHAIELYIDEVTI